MLGMQNVASGGSLSCGGSAKNATCSHKIISASCLKTLIGM